jgi:hypothetical protein
MAGSSPEPAADRRPDVAVAAPVRTGQRQRWPKHAAAWPALLRYSPNAVRRVSDIARRPRRPARSKRTAGAEPPGATTASRRPLRRRRLWSSTSAPSPLESMKLTRLRSTTTAAASSRAASHSVARKSPTWATSSSPSGAITVGSAADNAPGVGAGTLPGISAFDADRRPVKIQAAGGAASQLLSRLDDQSQTAPPGAELHANEQPELGLPRAHRASRAPAAGVRNYRFRVPRSGCRAIAKATIHHSDGSDASLRFATNALVYAGQR